MNKIKILMVVNTFPTMSQTFILNQVAGLLERGHDVYIYAINGQDVVFKENTNEIVDKYCLREKLIVPLELKSFFFKTFFSSKQDLFFNLKNIFIGNKNTPPLFGFYYSNFIQVNKTSRKIAAFDRKGYDIIHCQFGASVNHILGYKQNGLLKGLVVTSFRGYDISKNVREQGVGIYAKAFKEGDYFLPVCNDFKKRALELGCDENKICVQKSGIDCSKFPFTPHTIPGKGILRFITVGRLIEKKGIEYSIRAMVKVSEKFPNIQYTIIGDGELRKNLEDLIIKLKARKNIVILGWKNHEEIFSFLNDSHIFLAPNIESVDGNVDGIPNVLMEAMATGVPVISTFQPGIEELIENDVNGFLVKQRDEVALANKILYVISHPEILENVTKNARKAIENNHDREKLNDKLVEIYRGLLNSKR